MTLGKLGGDTGEGTEILREIGGMLKRTPAGPAATAAVAVVGAGRKKSMTMTKNQGVGLARG